MEKTSKTELIIAPNSERLMKNLNQVDLIDPD